MLLKQQYMKVIYFNIYHIKKNLMLILYNDNKRG